MSNTTKVRLPIAMETGFLLENAAMVSEFRSNATDECLGIVARDLKALQLTISQLIAEVL